MTKRKTNNEYFVFIFSIFTIFIVTRINAGIIGLITGSSYTNNMYVHVYKAPRTYDRIKFTDGPQAIVGTENYSSKKRTIFYFPGWGERPNNNIESVNLITDAYLKKGNLNVIVFDYSAVLSSQGKYNKTFWIYENYLESAINATKIGKEIGKYLKFYSNNYQNDSMFQLVAHSLGAQIMSYAAKKYGKGKLRLTGLDPAYPLFMVPYFRLQASDGYFVDIIHTDIGRYGQFKSLGTADFFPNDGKRIQPYCRNTSWPDTGAYCSHHMSWRYYAESINNEKGFPATGCADKSICTPLDVNSCTCNSYNTYTAFMGYGVDTSVKGNFYLRTNAVPPFAMGTAGERYLLPFFERRSRMNLQN